MYNDICDNVFVNHSKSDNGPRCHRMDNLHPHFGTKPANHLEAPTWLQFASGWEDAQKPHLLVYDVKLGVQRGSSWSSWNVLTVLIRFVGICDSNCFSYSKPPSLGGSWEAFAHWASLWLWACVQAAGRSFTEEKDSQIWMIGRAA